MFLLATTLLYDPPAPLVLSLSPCPNWFSSIMTLPATNVLMQPNNLLYDLLPSYMVFPWRKAGGVGSPMRNIGSYR